MKYTLEERLDIGRRIYDGEITKYAAAEQFGISINCARDYMRLYRDTNSLPPKQNSRNSHVAPSFSKEAAGMEEFQNMTKEEHETFKGGFPPCFAVNNNEYGKKNPPVNIYGYVLK